MSEGETFIVWAAAVGLPLAALFGAIKLVRDDLAEADREVPRGFLWFGVIGMAILGAGAWAVTLGLIE